MPAAGTFAAAIYMHRDRLGLSMLAVCELFPGFAGGACMSRRTWQDWENGVAMSPPWAQRLVVMELARQKK